MKSPLRGRTIGGVALAILLAASVAACDSASSSPGQPSASQSAAPAASVKPSSSAKPKPSASQPPAESSADPSASVPLASPAASSPASMCTGAASIKEFWAGAAKTMKWTVYCAVLPKGWSSVGGDWEGANGGKITFGYKGPKGARIDLAEGTICSDGLSACEPHDQNLGVASFGDMPGTLFTLGPDMGFAIYVEPGSKPSWSITGTGLDRATFTKLAAALAKVPRS